MKKRKPGFYWIRIRELYELDATAGSLREEITTFTVAVERHYSLRTLFRTGDSPHTTKAGPTLCCEVQALE